MPSQNQSNQGRGRGFAGMDEARQREIASMGGKAAHASGHAHEFTPEEAREAGRKGGEASHGGGRSASSRDDDRKVSARSGRDDEDRSRASSSSKSGSGRSAGTSRGR